VGLRRLLFLAVLIVILTSSVVSAQDNGIVLQMALPEFMRGAFSENTLGQFEVENPSVTVNFIYTDFSTLSPTPAASDITEHLDTIEEYVSSADVLAVTSNNLSVEATRAGYFLDLAPVVNGDGTLNTPDFIPALWQSFQWDQGVWALPVSTDITVMTYDPAAFDEAGLVYPNESWTMDDLANAARVLATRDTESEVTIPGLLVVNNGLTALMRSLSGQGFYDSSVIPNSPLLANPALEELLTTWLELEDEGVVGVGFTDNYQVVPLRVEATFGLGNFGDPEQTPRQGSVLPGGHAGLDVQGFAVSAGTLYPELSYALVKFLTNNVEIANNPFGIRPARQSLFGAEAQLDEGEGGGIRIFRANSPEVQALVDMALPAGLPVSELRFGDYVDVALTKMRDDELDAHTALQEAEQTAIANLQTAADRHDTTTIAVATPVPEVVLAEGEIALNFGLTSFINPLPNRDLWDQIIQEFVANDAQVSQVVLNTGFGGPRGNVSSGQDDCYYLPYNAVPSADLTTLLNLDPFLSTDASFDSNDVVGNTMAQLQRDNQTWALPIDIQPQVLQYHSEQFAQAGVPVPENGWTLDAFVDALEALKIDPDDPAPFVPSDTGTSLLILIAAYGGLPLDYTTNPPTVNFTDPATVEAIRQVLDLAKAGYIDYQELARANFIFLADGERDDAIYSEGLNGFNLRLTTGEGADENPYRMTTYPRGSQHSAISYNVGTTYISTSAQNPEACYRWISEIARHPELFSGMPARRSLINDPNLAATQGADVIAAYNQIDAILQDPTTVVLPSAFGGDSPANFILQFWLNRAFDNYVLNDADLDAELANAETFSQGYLECVVAIPPLDEATQGQFDYFQQFTECATRVDPSMASFFPAPQ
jgi:ABC-type glycerol-3-phosphate transport system substrate-binding protein